MTKGIPLDAYGITTEDREGPPWKPLIPLVAGGRAHTGAAQAQLENRGPEDK